MLCILMHKKRSLKSYYKVILFKKATKKMQNDSDNRQPLADDWVSICFIAAENNNGFIERWEFFNYTIKYISFSFVIVIVWRDFSKYSRPLEPFLVGSVRNFSVLSVILL